MTERRKWPALLTAGAISVGLFVSPTAGAAPAGSHPLEFGPNIIRTNEAPTGYSVTFRYDAPADVESVQIWGEWQFTAPDTLFAPGDVEARWGWEWQPGDIPASTPEGWLTAEMTRGSDGIWTWTTPLPSGTFHYYFVHECESPTASGCPRIIDPANPGWASELTPTGAQTISQVYVPSHPRHRTYDNDYQEPVVGRRAGTLEHVGYSSPESVDPPDTRYLAVYTPNGYDPHRATPYPTLYLSHGFGGNEGDWSTQGAAGHILENALNDRLALPMVVVMTNFNGLPGGIFAPDSYAHDLRNNVIPYVEANYNVSGAAADRAFGGLSWGGFFGLNLLYNETDIVEYYGLWSAAVFGPLSTPTDAQIENMKGVRGEIQMGTGLQDFLGNIGATSPARAQFIRDAGVDVTEYNVDGMHTWDVWRQELNWFIRNVAFRATTTEIATEERGHHTTLTAAVEPLGTSIAAPTGKVEFYDGDTYLGSAPLTRGVARLNASVRGIDTEGVTARYLGDRLFDASESTAS